MLASRFWVALGFITCVCGAATRADELATVEEIVVEKAEHDTYFRVSVKWPSADVPTNYGEFRAKSNSASESHDWVWPTESLSLIPQGKGSALVCRKYFTKESRPDGETGIFNARGDISSPAVFLGKLLEQKEQEFVLRCPSPEGKYVYLPLKIDFSKATKSENLAKEWLQGQIDFMQLFEQPADQSFFGYVRERLTARQGKHQEADTAAQNMQRTDGPERLYEITTGALALQESLQLDRMRNTAADNGSRDVAIDQIQGVTVKSHPWTEMIQGRKPDIEPITELVPEDQYYVQFNTSKNLTDYLDFLEAWGGSLLSQLEVGVRDYGVKEKVENQLCLKTSWLSNMLGPAVIERLAITGSDPYLREGSDVSVIFQLKAAPVFEAAVNRYIDEARKNHADIKEQKDEYGGASIQSLVTPDQIVRCYRAHLGNYYVYSNSPAAIRRIIDTQRGQHASLAKSLDFVYMRTIYPLKAGQEDGFIFLSDPFIRTLVGPRLRIAEKRRIETVTSLEIVKNAALMYLWENPGAKTSSLEELYSKGYLDAKHVVTEPGDRINWDPMAFTASSERYGRLGYLTPAIELPMDKITAKEKADYEQFRDRYQEYWRRYFDPIGIRITTGQNVSMSVTILPLIDASEYNQVRENFGGKAVPLEPIKRDGPVVMHFGAHLNPENESLKQVQTMALNMMPGGQRAAVEWIGERIEFWVEDSDALTSFIKNQRFEKIFEIPMVLAIEVKNPLGLAAFLVGAQTLIQTSSPNTVVFEQTEAHQGFTFTRIRLVQGGPLSDPELQKAALYYGKVGDSLCLSTSLEALHRIANQVSTATKPGRETGATTTKPASDETGHMGVRFDLKQAKKVQSAVQYYFSKQALAAERAHLQNLWLVAHTVGLDGAVPPDRVLGFKAESSLGNTYHYDALHDEVAGSVTGSAWNPLSMEQLPPDTPLNRLLNDLVRVAARLTLTKDGLRTDLTIQRGGK